MCDIFSKTRNCQGEFISFCWKFISLLVLIDFSSFFGEPLLLFLLHFRLIDCACKWALWFISFVGTVDILYVWILKNRRHPNNKYVCTTHVHFTQLIFEWIYIFLSLFHCMRILLLNLQWISSNETEEWREYERKRYGRS